MVIVNMNIKSIFGRFVCYFMGHKRGKPIPEHLNGAYGEYRVFSCPRCGRITKYKVKA